MPILYHQPNHSHAPRRALRRSVPRVRCQARSALRRAGSLHRCSGEPSGRGNQADYEPTHILTCHLWTPGRHMARCGSPDIRWLDRRARRCSSNRTHYRVGRTGVCVVKAALNSSLEPHLRHSEKPRSPLGHPFDGISSVVQPQAVGEGV